MKFAITSIAKNNVRVGTIFDFKKLPNVALETPLVLLSTKGGSMPHISYEVLQLLTSQCHLIQVPLPSTMQFYESLSEYEKGLSSFIGLKGYPTYCSVQDPGKKTPVGFNKKLSISLWGYNGKKLLSADGYMDLIEAFKPDMYQCLSDGDTDIETKKKRCHKAVENNISLFEACLSRHLKSEVLSSSGIFTSIGGGYDSEARRNCATTMADKPVNGFVFEGFHTNGAEAENIQFDSIKSILEETLPLLPKEKLRLIPGAWRPEVVLRLIEMGFDMFDSSLSYIVTERYSALVFDYQEIPFANDSSNGNKLDYILEISLKDDRFAEDFNPIKENCTCHTCKKFTRAYIHHLVNVKELLASTLLMMHNLHYMMEFFKSIRRAASEDNKIVLL